jgi:hypothetical protein
MDFLSFFIETFLHKVPVVAYLILGLIGCSLLAVVLSIKDKKLNSFSQFAPTVLTTAGLFGTFVGLTMGLKGLEFKNDNLDIQSFALLMGNLKAVFVYALSGVFSSLIFMLLNTFVLKLQNSEQSRQREDLKLGAKRHNQDLLEIQRNQEHSLEQLYILQKKQLDNQLLMQQDIAKLQFDNDNAQLAQLISTGVVQGLKPLLLEIKTAVADQGTEAIKKVLEDLKTEILLPMNGALNQTNDALKETTDAVKATIQSIENAQAHNARLIEAVGTASEKMENASEKMNGLVDKINGTVAHMDDIQVAQKVSLDGFNQELQTNLARIKPAIEEGLDTAKDALIGAIDTASTLMSTSIESTSKNMQHNIETVLNQSGTQLKEAVTEATTKLNQSVTDTIAKQNESINHSFKQFDASQDKLNTILNTFSTGMNGHLDRMATELEKVGKNAESVINTASNNLERTLGDIDEKLLRMASGLEQSLELFRKQYQESLTLYLDEQTKNLDGFLNRQNEQLEQTIGQQREGLVEVTNSLTEQFKFMDEKQRDINSSHTQLIKVINGTGISILPKVESIARELNRGEEKLSQELVKSSQHLDDVAKALESLGEDLPPAFEKAFQQLDKNYKQAFEDLDHGLKDAVNRLGTTVGALAQAIHLHDAMTQ